MSLKALESLAQNVGHMPGRWRDILGSCSHVCLDRGKQVYAKKLKLDFQIPRG